MKTNTKERSNRYYEDDFEMALSLYESEYMIPDFSEEERHAQRCIAKGKRAKRKQRNNLFWWRHREFPSNPYKEEGRATGNARARADVRELSRKAKLLDVESYEDYEVLDILPAKAHVFAW